MSYRIAGIDVHKKMLAVVLPDVEVDGEYELERLTLTLIGLALVCLFLSLRPPASLNLPVAGSKPGLTQSLLSKFAV